MKIKQRNQTEIFCEIEKTPTECFQLLKEVYGDNVMSRTRVSEWHKWFIGGQEKVEDGERLGRLLTSKTEKKFQKTVKFFGKIDV
jgi:hypothetical protein